MVFPEDGIGARLFPAELVGVRHRLLPRAGRRGARRAGRVTAIERGPRSRSTTARRSRPTRSSRGSGSSRRSSSPRRPGCRSRTGSSSTSAVASAAREDVFAAGDVARFPVAALGGDDARRARGPREEPRPGGRRATWPARTSPTTTCRSSTPTCSTSATRRSASSTRATRRSPSGASRTAKGVVCYLDDGAAAARLPALERLRRVDAARELIRAGEPVDAAAFRGLMA